MVPNIPKAITHRRILNIALPIMISNATVPILGAVDTGVVGQLGEAAPIGAVGIGAIILGALYWIFGFLRMGTTGLAAQAVGDSNMPEVSALLIRAILVGFGAGLFFVLFQIPLFWLSFQVAPASTEVEILARDYMQIRIFSAPAAITIFGITGWLIAQERTRAVLVIQLWMNGINIILDLLFVLRFEWGVEGVAIATFIAEWSGLALALYFARDGLGQEALRDRTRIFDRVKIKRMASVNSDIMIRSVLLQAGFVSFLFLGAGLGDVTLAANQVLIQFVHITAYALDGFAFSAEALVGQAIGAKNQQRLRRSVVLSSYWGLLVTGLMSMGVLLFGSLLINLMAKDMAVQTAAHDYLPWVVLAPITGLAAWMLDAIFIGATRTADMRNMMIISFLVYVCSVAILLPLYGNHGLWAALMIFFVIRGVTLGARYPALERGAG